MRSTTVPLVASAKSRSPLCVLICAGPFRRPMKMSPSRRVRRALAPSSILTVPCALSKVSSPSRPTPRSSTEAALASTREPAGSWMVTSTDPVLPRIRFLGAAASMRSTAAGVGDGVLRGGLHIAVLGGVGGQPERHRYAHGCAQRGTSASRPLPGRDDCTAGPEPEHLPAALLPRPPCGPRDRRGHHRRQVLDTKRKFRTLRAISCKCAVAGLR